MAYFSKSLWQREILSTARSVFSYSKQIGNSCRHVSAGAKENRSRSKGWTEISEKQKREEIPQNKTIGTSKEQQALIQEDFFKVKELVKIDDFFNARVHFGHKIGCRNPYMTPYLFGSRMGMDIIDLEQTVEHMQTALNFIAHIAYRGGIILFVSRNLQSMPLIEQTAQDVYEYAHCRTWKGGSFTNAVNQNSSMIRLPDLCIFVTTLNSVMKEHRGITDCAKMLIPTVGVVDSNCDPRLISYPVPGNDDTPDSLKLYCNLFKTAIAKGKQKRKEDGLCLDTEKIPILPRGAQ